MCRTGTRRDQRDRNQDLGAGLPLDEEEADRTCRQLRRGTLNGGSILSPGGAGRRRRLSGSWHKSSSVRLNRSKHQMHSGTFLAQELVKIMPAVGDVATPSASMTQARLIRKEQISDFDPTKRAPAPHSLSTCRCRSSGRRHHCRGACRDRRLGPTRRRVTTCHLCKKPSYLKAGAVSNDEGNHNHRSQAITPLSLLGTPHGDIHMRQLTCLYRVSS